MSTNKNSLKAGETVSKEKNNGITEEVLCAEYEAVYHYVLSLCHNESEAQDVTQDAFLKALRASNEFSGESSLYTWLCAIAKNAWLNKCKKQNRESIPDDEKEIKQSKSGSIEDYLVEKDMSFQIHSVIHSLDEPYKEVFSLRIFGQLSFVDIAKLFSKTDSWARVTYHRARKMIIDKIRKEGYYE